MHNPHLGAPYVVSVLALAWILGAVGCAGSQKEALGPSYLVKTVNFEFEDDTPRFKKKQLLGHLHSGETSWVPFNPDYPLNEALLAVDASRIEALYRSYGYYQAAVVDVRVRRDAEAEEVDVVFVIAEGEPVLVKKVEVLWEGAEAVDEDERALVLSFSTLKVGEPFEVVRLNNTLGALRQELKVRGFPHATVTSAVDVFEDGLAAEATLKITPRDRARIGEIRIEGLSEVPLYMIEREVRFAEGAPFSPQVMKQLEASVKAMNVFRWVAAGVAGKVDDEGLVNVTIKVSEADPQSVQVGAAFSFESARWQQSVLTRYTHTNIFGHLTRMDLSLKAGWAELPDPFDLDAHGPSGGLGAAFTKKGLLEDQLVWTLYPAFGLDVLDGYQFYSPSNLFGVSRWFFRTFNVDVSHNLRFVDFFNVSPRLDTNASILGRDFRDPFFLSLIQLKAAFYLVDSILSPRNGAILDLVYDVAGGALGGDYSFQRVYGDLRAYKTLGSSLSVAFRAQSGLILPYGEEGGAPLNFKFYLGGANSVRGWGSRRLSPQLYECTDDETECKGIPIGGFTMLAGNLELRWNLVSKLYLVGFVDMGDVQAGVSTFKVDEWNYTAGPGLRVDSPVGLFRLDAGFRLNDPGVYPDEEAWALYFGLGETF